MRKVIPLIILVTFAVTPVLSAERQGTFFSSQPRVVAIGDVHGDFEAVRTVIRLTGIIDENDQWIGGKTYFVQVGDQLDRGIGDGERKIVDFLEKLRIQARKAGGKVIPLNGNHETMNVQLDFRYVFQGGFNSFSSFYNRASHKDPEVLKLPEEQRGRAVAFRPGGPYAKLLAGRNSIVIIGDTLFVHGGVLPRYAKKGIEKINWSISSWMRGLTSAPEAVTDYVYGPLWSRHFSDDVDAERCLLLKETLDHLKIKRMVVAHTPQKEGINSACGGKVWRVDTGLSQLYGGKLQAIEILNDRKINVIEGERAVY